jgi:hypothetical protein
MLGHRASLNVLKTKLFTTNLTLILQVVGSQSGRVYFVVYWKLGRVYCNYVFNLMTDAVIHRV